MCVLRVAGIMLALQTSALKEAACAAFHSPLAKFVCVSICVVCYASLLILSVLSFVLSMFVCVCVCVV